MLPPWPPSPPEGPPRGTYFSRRKATQPLPPSPAFTKILASSTNMGTRLRKGRFAIQRRYRPITIWKRKTRSNGPDRGSEKERTKSSAKCCHRIQLVRGGLGLLCGRDADEAAVTALVLELHESGNHCEERVVLALTDVLSGLVLRAALAHQNRAGVDQLSAKALDAQPLSV